MSYSDHYDHAQLRKAFSQTALKKHLAYFEDILRTRLIDKPHGDLPRWQNALNALPEQACELLCLDHITVKATGGQDATLDNEQLRQTLMGLHPWRKGPFQFFDVTVDTEWHSDWKWQRVLPHLSDLHNRRVLDVGGGNGYHAWRMYGAGARLVINIDPSPLFYHQFHAVKRYHTEAPVFQLPMTLEQMPNELQCFDTVFSMGVLYHRKSPIEHLEQLKMMLKVGGELVLETLVIDGDEQQLLLPEDRYAQMNNVYFLPSTRLLESMLKKVGFREVRTVDINVTSTEEQRPTPWMQWQSLPDFLDPNNPELTVEGHPRPCRAVVIATR